MARFNQVTLNFIRNEDGAALVEYALLIALIAIICVVGITTLGKTINTKFTSLSTDLP